MEPAPLELAEGIGWGGLLDSCGEKIDGVQYSVFVGNCGGSEVVVTELNCVRDD